MDDLTHILLGATTAQLGFRQRLGRPATWLAMAATLLPDLDMPLAAIANRLGHPASTWAPLLTHRGITHSLLVGPATALLLGWLWWRVSRRRWLRTEARVRPPAVVDSAAHPQAVAVHAAAARREAQEAFLARPRFLPRFACLLLAAVCHPLLDACTSYGTELLWPFRRHRFALDAVPIIDPLFTLLLAVTLVVCWMVRRRAAGRAATVGCAGQSAARLGSPEAGLHTLDASIGMSAPRVEPEDGPHALPLAPMLRRTGAPLATALVAAVGLLLCGSYIAAGKVLHDRVVNLAREALGLTESPTTRPATTPAGPAARSPASRAKDSSLAAAMPVSVEAYPAPGSIFLWRVVAELRRADGRPIDGIWLVARVRPWYEPAHIKPLWRSAPDAANSWTLRTVLLPEALEYARFARCQFRAVYSYSAQDKKHVVEFHDMRYGWPIDSTDSLWPLRVSYDSAGRLLEVRKDHRSREDLWQMMRGAWTDLWRP